MQECRRDATGGALRVMQHAQLLQHGSAVVVDAFAGEAIVGGKGIEPAKWDGESSAGCRKTLPCSEVGAADDDFQIITASSAKCWRRISMFKSGSAAMSWE